MAFSLRPDQRQIQKLALYPQLMQSIQILQLSNLELADKISAEITENPVLEEVTTGDEASTEDTIISEITREISGNEPVFEKNEEQIYEDADDGDGHSLREDEDNRSIIENVVAHEESLQEHLLGQARLIANDKELAVLESVISYIDDRGFLIKQAAVIAKEINESPDIIDKIIKKINRFDPAGCGAKDIKDSLIIQASMLYEHDILLHKIIADHFNDIKKFDLSKIAKSLKISLKDITEKARLIHNLDPYPGRKYSFKNTRFIVPDVEVKYIDNELIVTLNDERVPKLRVSGRYSNILKNKKENAEAVEFIKERIESAKNLIKSIENRKETILKIVRIIMEHQKDFLTRGPGCLKSLKYSDVAHITGLHESTISRTVTNKYAETPWGTFELKSFFSSKLNSDCSSDEAMKAISDIISRENSAHPFSDQELAKKLKADGINIAQRTIAKYRTTLRIPSAGMRKKINIIKNGESK